MRLNVLIVNVLLNGMLLWSSSAEASLLDDAKSHLDRLTQVGNVSRAPMETAVRNARSAFERQTQNAKTDSAQRISDCQKRLDKLKLLEQADAGKANSKLEKSQKQAAADGKVTKSIQDAETALKQATTAATQFEASAPQRERNLSSFALSAVDSVATSLTTRINDSKGVLRSLVPPPAGSRSATRKERRCVKIPGGGERCSDVDVPNPPPTDKEYQEAIGKAGSVLNDVAKADRLAESDFTGRLRGMQQEMSSLLTAVTTATSLINEAEKIVGASIH